MFPEGDASRERTLSRGPGISEGETGGVDGDCVEDGRLVLRAAFCCRAILLEEPPVAA